MLFGRRPGLLGIVRRLEACARDARLSAMKLRVAHRFASERRAGVDRVLIQTALTGFPISTDMMAGMYVASAESSARKALKNALRVERVLREAYPEIHAGRVGEALERAISILRSASDLGGLSGQGIVEVAEEVEGAAGLLAEAAGELRGLAEARGRR